MVLEQLDINMEKHKPRAHQKFSSKWIIYITIRPKNIRQLLKSIEQNVCDSGLGKDGGGTIHLRKISILDFIKIQNFCSINDTFKKTEKKNNPETEKKMSSIYIPENSILRSTYKELLQLNI